MKNKRIKICIAAALVIVLIGTTALACLYNNGLFKPAHKYVKPSDNQIRVACVGDSVTYGMTMKNWSKNAYPFVLRKMLGDGYCTENFGFSGRTVMKNGDRPYVSEKLYEQSLEFYPDFVIIQIGSNDSKFYNWTDKEMFKADFEKLIESYSTLPSNPKIFICTPPPAFEYKGEVKYDISPEVIENEIAPAIKDVAEKLNFEVIDLMEMFSDRADLFNDGLHPNELGAKMIAEAVFKAITNNS